MHFEILIEDKSGKTMIDILMRKLLGEESIHTFRVNAYRGIGHIPKDLQSKTDPKKRVLLSLLPRLLKGLGSTYAKYPADYEAVVILVCDLDNRCLKRFREELFDVLESCRPAPKTRFCIAIEEGEAWFLGDLDAVKKAYPQAKQLVMESYVNDSICGTWEKLADAIHPGGSKKLTSRGYPEVGREKSKWAERITPKMNVQQNQSPSFCYFRDTILALGKTDASTESSLLCSSLRHHRTS